jgi:hypothetical protein
VRLKCNTSKRLGEEVGSVDNPRSVINKEKFGVDVRADEVIANVNVLGLAVIGVVNWERLRAVVVSADDERWWTRELKLSKRLSKPDSLLDCSREGDVLSFSSGESNTVLFLCWPADGPSSKRPYKPRDRRTILFVTSPVCIWEPGEEKMSILTTIVQAMCTSSLQVSKDSFSSRKVAWFWGCTVLRKDENGEGDIRARTYLQEEKGSNYALKDTSEISYRHMNISGEPERMITIQRCFHGIAVGEIVFCKEGIDEHLLMNPQLTSLQISLELNTKEIP